MGKLSMSLALVALLAVAGTYAARPIDVSNEESIKPMNTLEEQVVSDSSRELLAMHYPPPPPLSETQGNEGRPVISQSIGLTFNSSEHASNFSTAVGTIRCSNEGNECAPDASRKLLDMHGPAQDFAEEYLNNMLDSTESGDGPTAEDGVVTVSATDDEVTMTSNLYFPDGTSEGDLETAKSTLEGRSLVSRSQYESLADIYGISTDYDAFTTAAEGGFTVESGAQGLKASVFVGVAVILSAFLLA